MVLRSDMDTSNAALIRAEDIPPILFRRPLGRGMLEYETNDTRPLSAQAADNAL
jgi:hypothetical protein